MLHAIVWGIWKAKNNRIFLDKSKNIDEVIEAIIREVGSWPLVTMEFKDLLLFDFVRDWVTSISCSLPSNPLCHIENEIPPPRGTLKLNFDGASKSNLGLAGYGCMIRDFEGIVYKVLSCPLAQCDSTKAETQSMLMGLKELKIMGTSSCIIEGD